MSRGHFQAVQIPVGALQVARQMAADEGALLGEVIAAAIAQRAGRDDLIPEPGDDPMEAKLLHEAVPRMPAEFTSAMLLEEAGLPVDHRHTRRIGNMLHATGYVNEKRRWPPGAGLNPVHVWRKV